MKFKGRIKKLYKYAKALGDDVKRLNMSSFASSIAFCFLTSLPASIMFLCTLIKYLPVEISDVVDLLLDFSSRSLHKMIYDSVNEIYSASDTLLPLTALATLFTASLGVMGLIRGLNGVLEIEDKRSIIVVRLWAVLYTLILISAVVISIIIIGFGRTIMEFLNDNIPKIAMLLQKLFFARYFIIWLLLTVIFDLSYAFLPAIRQRILWSLPGAALSSLGWCLVTGAFSLYIDIFNGFSIYGSMTLIMVLFSWFYVCFFILIMGALLNIKVRQKFGSRRVTSVKVS